MLEPYTILDTIPAYKFEEIHINKEWQDNYKEATSRFDADEIRSIIQGMLTEGDIDETAEQVLRLILMNKDLFTKTKIVTDGSYRTLRVYKYYKYNNFYENTITGSYTTLYADWTSIVHGLPLTSDIIKIRETLTDEDILLILNNIEEIFIQVVNNSGAVDYDAWSEPFNKIVT